MRNLTNGLVLLILIGIVGCGRAQETAIGVSGEAQPQQADATTKQVDSKAWLVEQKTDPLTDQSTVTGTLGIVSDESGRYEFSIVLDGSHEWRGNDKVTLKAAIFDAEPTGLNYIENGQQMIKLGTRRLDNAQAEPIAWAQSKEFRNVFTLDLNVEELASVRQRVLITGLRSNEEVFELPRNASSEAIWRALELRVGDSRSRAVESAEKAAIARKPGHGTLISDYSTRQALSGAASIRSGMSKAEVFLGMERQGPIMATQGAVAEWHYCSTGQNGGNDQFLTIFFQQGRVVGVARYSAPNPVVVTETSLSRVEANKDCTENVKTGSYVEPPEVAALRSDE